MGIGDVFKADALPVLRQGFVAVKAALVIGQAQIIQGIERDLAVHQHGKGTDGLRERRAHKQYGHGNGGGIGKACPMMVNREVENDADSGQHQRVAPVDGEGVVAVGADGVMAVLCGGGGEIFVVEAFGAVAVEFQLFVAVKAGFVVGVELVFKAAHGFEAGVDAFDHIMAAQNHNGKNQGGDDKQLRRQPNQIGAATESKQNTLHQFGQPRKSHADAADVVGQAGQKPGFAGKLDLRIVRIHDAFEQLRAQFEHKLMPEFRQTDLRKCGGRKIKHQQGGKLPHHALHSGFTALQQVAVDKNQYADAEQAGKQREGKHGQKRFAVLVENKADDVHGWEQRSKKREVSGFRPSEQRFRRP